MALSAGGRQAVALAGGWIVVCAASAFSFLYFSEIKDVARGVLGLPAPDARVAGSAAYKPQAVKVAKSSGVVELKAGTHGHYYTGAEINGRPIKVMVDTGASIVALTADDASRIGLFIRDRDYTHRVSTANGHARVAPVVLERVSIGGITIRNVPAAVSEPGMLATSLLGMSFLGRLQRVDMRSGVLLLQE
jgi:aspartyl protease family protein